MLDLGTRYEGNWADVPGNDRYAVSDQGEIVDKHTGKPRATSRNQNGNRMVTLLSPDNGRATRSVAVMVAECFLPRTPMWPGNSELPEFFDTPIHVNGDKGDCRVENLSWRPRWFAMAYHKQFLPENEHMRNMLALGVYLVDTDESFENSWDAAVKYGMLNSDIVLHLQNKTPPRLIPYGFSFKYIYPDGRIDD